MQGGKTEESNINQESNASNGVQIGVETKKLWLFEDNYMKLWENFTVVKSGGKFRSCEISCEINLRLRNPPVQSQIFATDSVRFFSRYFVKSNSEDVSSEDEWLGFLSLGAKVAGAPKVVLVQDSMTEASQPLFVPPSIEAPIDPSEPSVEPQPPTTESQIPFGMTPKRDLQASARAQRFIPSTAEDPTVIHFTIEGHHGILGARHIAKALHIPYEPARPEEYRVWARPSQSNMVHILSKGTSTRPYLLRKKLPPSIEGPQEEAVESGCHSFLFPRLLYQILEHLGYPSEPQLEHRRIFREIFTLDKWTSMTAYDVELGAPARPEHLEMPQPEHLEEPMLEVASSAPHASPETPQLYQPHPSLTHLSVVLPYLFQSLEAMSYFVDIDHYLEHLDLADGSHTCTSGSVDHHPDPTYCHP
ncbi:hypothetical protein CK203_060740 [Vitis vinifera]|uniref:Uncharacterized protein n=1 Tax=Vitis vinifera TaxID=29760 RepID=A0A438FRR7_VITVI|nr:hypothetical protein CK203_060740 [Vitis vinifera]